MIWVIYLEFVGDLLIGVFIWVLRWFVGRWGMLGLIVLDNVKIFKVVNKVLEKFYNYFEVV